ncbi:hypothetical protein MTsPCn5_36450 [Croceitalea sp. MTPC5]|uniref:S41 family peptidase n=1 Tax=Croceitalea sp. MTPC5 TaxID=3056565 RepID=UPI002B38A855|nr:hypothetical protein MTsPCn5_36450 [Croceitalea sp. MTPC5]
MEQDIDDVIRIIEDIHPYPYRFKSKDEIRSYSNRLKENLKDSLSISGFWRIIDELVVCYNDAHTSTFPYPLFHKFHRNGGLFFPFHVAIKNNELFITKTLEGQSELVGKKIMGINGIKDSTLIQDMLKHSKKELPNLKKHDISSNFPFYLWKTFGWKGPFNVELKDTILQNDGANYEVVFKDWLSEDEDWFQYDQLHSDIAYIKISNFNANRKNAKRRYKETFKAINEKHTDHLILDFRNHDGGQDLLGEDLARYLYNKPFKRLKKTLWKVTPEYQKAFEKKYIPKALRWIKPLYLLNPYSKVLLKKKKNKGLYELDYKTTKPHRKAKRFKGNVYLLINNNTFSAGSVFAGMFQDYGMGEVIGQETGNLSSFSAYALVTHQLPNSKIKFRISSAYSVRTNGDESKTPVEPDIRIATELDGLDYLLKKIREN